MSKLVDVYLDSPDFGATVRDLHNDAPAGARRLRPRPRPALAKDGLAGMDLVAANRAIMEAPLRLIEHVVSRRRALPATSSAPTTPSSARPPRPPCGVRPSIPAGDAWQVQDPPSDLRNAGVLADRGCSSATGSTRTNANRGRANAVARAFLCVDFNDRDLEIDPSVNLADPEAVADAVQANPDLRRLSSDPDPLAAFFWGYKPGFVPLLVPTRRTTTPRVGSPPSSGSCAATRTTSASVGDSLADLGAILSVDPRFSLCAARRAYAYFPSDRTSPPSRLSAPAELQAVLQDSDDYKAMPIKALVLADDFAARAQRRRARGRKRASPYQLARHRSRTSPASAGAPTSPPSAPASSTSWTTA